MSGKMLRTEARHISAATLLGYRLRLVVLFGKRRS
jgi:hypothetical protein